ncbi:hypothetical protein BS17DRAFT_772542 [Gyrodon lividus]|nr:hypothetical protein BS17DRAFT_772542 [Gyrodon lividus]
MLVKGAYTGIAASVIDGKTLHVLNLGGIHISGREPGPQTLKRLAAFWKGTRKVHGSATVTCETVEKHCKRLLLAGKGESNLPFGGLTVILCNIAVDTTDEMFGRRIYEWFNVVVRLKEQVRVTDPQWLDLLQHGSHGDIQH